MQIGIHIEILASTTTTRSGLASGLAIVPPVEDIAVGDDLRQTVGQAAIVAAVLIETDGPIAAKVTAIGVVAMDVAIRVADPLSAPAAAQLADHRGALLARRFARRRVRGFAAIAAALRVHLELGCLLSYLKGCREERGKASQA